jgi:hypothetical protein
LKLLGGKIDQPKTLDMYQMGVNGAQFIVDKLGAEGGKLRSLKVLLQHLNPLRAEMAPSRY